MISSAIHARNDMDRVSAFLAMWLRSDRGIVLGTTPRATGTTPPAVTIAGTLEQVVGLRIEVTTGGARADAAVKVSFDSGQTFGAPFAIAAGTIDLGRGIVATFPVGTYNVNNVYRGTVAQWKDQSGAGNSPFNATAATQPLLIIEADGKPSVVFTGTEVLAHGLTLQPPATVCFVAKRNTVIGNYQPIASFSAGGTHGLYVYAKSSATDHWGIYANGNADAGAAGATQLDVFKRGILVARAYTDIDFLTNEAQTTNQTGGLFGYNGGAAIGYTGGTQNLEGAIRELAGFTRTLGGPQRLRVSRAMRRRWGV